ncbi:MAG: flagellar basal body protein FliL [Rhodospirillaceae bacterium]|jgi:flagellar protein FliL|nr:flagellar basal body protein FliL [Rhodospirillaceae bacterium]MBT5565364.1 flagellar basal body protein FliL [Rhodospirillaceae bacterium]MBT6089103.1 flagellar basal body protein FliL [Rhodospirillaceae bacterium]MBT6960177.1 flagellar basal body protein FliL [Rhodospirillaceae bacterium]MBT7449624.1 flagellar basal body protein FliL [Rhodospirillaceae bacterium]
MSDSDRETEDDPATRYTADQIIKMGQDEPEPEPKSRKMLFVVLALLVCIGGGAAAYFLGYVDPVLAMFADEPEPPVESGLAENTTPAGSEIYFELPDFLVNLNAQGRKRSFLKAKISVELADEAGIAKVEMAMPRIQDKVQIYLRELRLEDLQGAAAINRIRIELLDRVTTAAGPIGVTDVLLRELSVQ